jgi:hypothetical protein
MAAKAVGVINRKNKTPEPTFLCPYCNRTKAKSNFYASSDPMILTGVTHMCKDCAEKIARNYDARTGTFGDCTRASVQDALERLDKPFLESVWTSAYTEVNSEKTKNKFTNIWSAYIRTISAKQYKAKRWRDGDVYASYKENAERVAAEQARQTFQNIDLPEVAKNQEIKTEYQKNREDVIRLIGYDPFETEAERDKPLLYSQLVGYLDMGDGDSNEDMMRTSSVISIVRGFLQQSRIDDMIADIMKDPMKASNNVGTMKSLQDMKKNVNTTILHLAAENCLSLKNNKNASKGDTTWTGKTKKLKDMNLREAEVNGFDIGTCRGMQQVMDMSNASILKALRLDESEYSDMVAEQRQMITNLSSERDSYKEITRILLRENLDLKDLLEDNDLLDEENLVDLEELFSPFTSIVEQDGDDEEEDELEEGDDDEELSAEDS